MIGLTHRKCVIRVVNGDPSWSAYRLQRDESDPNKNVCELGSFDEGYQCQDGDDYLIQGTEMFAYREGKC